MTVDPTGVDTDGGADLGFERVRVVCRNLGDEDRVKCLNDLKLL